MKPSSLKITSMIAVGAVVSLVGFGLVVTAPAQAQDNCTSQERCEALKDEVKNFRRDTRELRRERRELRRQLRDLPADSPERKQFREQVRGLREEARGLQREFRSIRQDLREQCRGCLGDGTGNPSN